MTENLFIGNPEEQKFDENNNPITKQEYIDKVQAEMVKLEDLSDEELDIMFAEKVEKEPEGDFKDFMKDFLSYLEK